jgi:hypothetical protein
MNDIFERRLRDAARSAPTPEAPSDLIQRVMAERGRGERVILPVADTRARRSYTWWLTVAAAACIAVAAALVVPRSMARSPLLADEFSSTGFFVSTAFAEQTSNGPAVPALAGVNGSSIAAKTYRYRLSYVDSTGRVLTDSIGGGSLIVTAARVGNVDAWRFELTAQQVEDGQKRTASETTYVTRRELRPIARAVHIRPYRRFDAINIGQRFARDSVLGEVSVTDPKTHTVTHRSIGRRLPPQFGPYVSDAYAPLALTGVRLSADWSRSLSVIGWAVVPMDVFYPVTLRVVGEERIATAAGAIDCWKLYVVAGRQRRMEWVRKSDGMGIRALDEAVTPNGHRRYELINP